MTGATASLRRTLDGLPGVDAVGLEARAASLGTRSIKTTAKQWAIDLAISMVDLTTLEGSDTPGKVRALSAKALRPDPTDPSCPSAAAVCVYPDMVATVREAVGDRLHVASVATAFPCRRAALDVKLADTDDAVEAGADEIDMVIDRGAFLPATSRGSTTRSWRSRRPLARPTSRSSSRPASCRPTTTSGAHRGSPWRPAPTSSRPAPARSSPRRPSRSRC